IDAYQHASEVQPRAPEPLLSAGVLLEKENKFSDAAEKYKQVLALDASSSDALAALANLYMRGRQVGPAEEMLRKIVSLHPDNAAAHLQLARVLEADGQHDPAI